jgi:hypothetical protein
MKRRLFIAASILAAMLWIATVAAAYRSSSKPPRWRWR